MFCLQLDNVDFDQRSFRTIFIFDNDDLFVRNTVKVSYLGDRNRLSMPGILFVFDMDNVSLDVRLLLSAFSRFHFVLILSGKVTDAALMLSATGSIEKSMQFVYRLDYAHIWLI
jgi:hypothetical protein